MYDDRTKTRMGGQTSALSIPSRVKVNKGYKGLIPACLPACLVRPLNSKENKGNKGKEDRRF
jgi:hypothetical protein